MDAHPSRNHIIYKCLLLVALILLSIAPLFLNLGKFPIRMWDEARYANNSIDMISTGNPLVVEHLGRPDLENTKPPLVIWMQALCMKMFGITEWAVRLPSAAFGLLTVMLVFLFCERNLGSSSVGFISGLILISSKGFICNHVVRTGDLDGVLVFWLTLGICTFVDLAVQKPIHKTMHFILLGIAFTMGFLTKGVAGFFFIPAMGLLLLLHKNNTLINCKQFYISGMISLALCLGYYLVRETFIPGYLHKIWMSEVMRYNTAIMSWHMHPFNFYFNNMVDEKFQPFIWLIPMVPVSWLISYGKSRMASIYLAIACACYFILISIPTVKLEWYDAPLYPLLAVLIANSLYLTARFLLNRIALFKESYKIELIILLAAGLFLFNPYRSLLSSLEYPEKSIYTMELDGAYLKYLDATFPAMESCTVFKLEQVEEHYDQVLFYKRAFESEQKMKINLTRSMSFANGELVMATKSADQVSLESMYNVRKLNTWNTGILYHIISKK